MYNVTYFLMFSIIFIQLRLKYIIVHIEIWQSGNVVVPDKLYYFYHSYLLQGSKLAFEEAFVLTITIFE